jgi:hypothetical protein
VEIVVENKGQKELYLYVYDLRPSWYIQNALRATYYVIPPRQDGQGGFTGVLRRKIKMTVPQELRAEGQHKCEDLIKVFITSQPTVFDLLELPKLGKPVQIRINGRTDQEEITCSSENWAVLNFPIRTFFE